MTSAKSLKTIRVMHHYLGLFFAPAILFFAITGGLQMFGLYETTRGSSYVPPNFLVHLSQLHKKGTLYIRSRKVSPPGSPKPEGPQLGGTKPDKPNSDGPKPDNPKPAASPQLPSSLPIKIFLGATSLALVF